MAVQPSVVSYDGETVDRGREINVWSFPALPCALGERRLLVRDDDVVRGCRDAAASVGRCLTLPLLLQAWQDALSSAPHLAPELIGLLPDLLTGLATADLSKASSSQEEKEAFVDSALQFLLSEETLFAPTDFTAFRSAVKPNNLCKATSSLEDQVCKFDTKPPTLSNVRDSLEHIYSRFSSPFNPCVSNSGSATTLARSHNASESSASLYGCQRNVLIVSHSLLAVAACARLMGPSFIMFFSRVMCPLLEMCGDSNLLIAHSARKSLERMSSSCGYSGVVDLVEAAVPHFWYPLSMQLRRPRVHPRAPLILQVALACGSRRSSACLTDCLQQLMYELLRCLDSHESLCPQQLLAVLRLFMATKHKAARSADGQSPVNKLVEGEHKMREAGERATTTGDEVQKGFSAPRPNIKICPSKVVRSNVVTTNSGPNSSEGNVKFNSQIPNDNVGIPLNCSVINPEVVVNCQEKINEPNHPASVSSVSSKCCEINPSQCAKRESDSKASQSFCDVGNTGPSLGSLVAFMKELHRKEEQLREKFEVEQASILEEVNVTMLKEEESARIAGKPYWEKSSADFAHPDEDCSDSGVGTTKEETNASDIEDAGEALPEKDNKRKDEEVPEDVRLIVSILERCCFLLHTRDRETSLILLDTIELGCLALREWENSQLPVLHKVWKPLLLRIKDHDRPVSLRSLTVCCTMVACSGDFLRKRCLKDLLPALNRFLVLQSSASRLQTARTGYLMSAAYTTQVRLLETLYPELVDKLNLSGAEMVDAVNCYAMYLDCSQPPALVKASVRGLRAVSTTHPETVWFALSCLLPPRVVEPGASGLHVLRLDGGLDRRRVPAEAQLLFNELS